MEKETEDSMDNFYDINDFIVFAFKKWKTILVVIVLAAVVFAGNRAVSLYGDYRAQAANLEADVNQAPDEEETDGTQTASAGSEFEEPMWVKVQNVVEITDIDPDTVGTEAGTLSSIIDAFRKLGGTEDVMNTMYERWYEQESQEYQRRVEKLHDYGYILDKEVNYPYTRNEFYDQFLVNGRDVDSAMSLNISYEENYIVLGFKSMNEEQARRVADDFTETLASYVQQKIGGFSYDVIDTSVLYDLPSATSGTQPTRVASSSTPAVSSITMSYIAVQSVKGMVWGGIIGVLIAAVLVLLMYMMTRRVYVLSDVKKYDVPVLGMGFLKKKSFPKIRAGFHSAMEGGSWDPTGCRKIARHISEIAAAKEIEGRILVTGTCKEGQVKRLVQILNAAAKSEKFCYVESVAVSAQVFQKIKEEGAPVLLVEMFGDSLKDNIAFEISELRKQDADILGMLVFE